MWGVNERVVFRRLALRLLSVYVLLVTFKVFMSTVVHHMTPMQHIWGRLPATIQRRARCQNRHVEGANPNEHKKSPEVEGALFAAAYD